MKKVIRYLYNKIRLKNKVIFDYSVKISLNSSFEGMNKIYSNSRFDGSLGFGSYINEDCYITGEIGRFTSIAPYVRVNIGRHPYEYPYVSTSPCFVSLRKQNGSTFVKSQMFEEVKYVDEENKIAVLIGNDCWIGDGAFITGGVKIGDGAVVLAHAVVTKDIPPYAVVGGVPAKVLRYRYDDDTVKLLMEFKWWNKSQKWLTENIELIQNIDLLKELIKK